MLSKDYSLKPEERVLFALRELYQGYGYSRYKMSKFEEYDLYAQNKDFLISDGIITFTDTDGRLMALKPDVTLSIIKSQRHSSGLKKLYYSENVYRISGSTRSFREIMQTGLECLGEVDLYCLCEVIQLASRSLRVIDERSVLDLSHMGVVSALVEALEPDSLTRARLLACIGEKNADGVRKLCPGKAIDGLLALIDAHGPARDVIARLRPWCSNGEAKEALDELEAVTQVLEANDCDNVQLDFSIVNDMNYYNGIVFMGYIQGIPASVLSGGQYDKLVRRMGAGPKAVGFAIYMDQLERLHDDSRNYDVDTVVLYEKGADVAELARAVRRLTESGRSAMALQALPEKLRYRELMHFPEGGDDR